MLVGFGMMANEKAEEKNESEKGARLRRVSGCRLSVVRRQERAQVIRAQVHKAYLLPVAGYQLPVVRGQK
jgi:hypothetical protein